MKKNTYSGVLATTKASKVITPQTQAIPGREKEMARNNGGGVSFVTDAFTQLDRFLILGTEGGTYYTSERKMTVDNAKNVVAAVKADGVRVVARIVEISKAGRAPKNDPALFALALAMTYGNDATKAAAYAAIPSVARIGTHLFHLAAYVNEMRGWGRGLRNGFANWYNSKTPMQLAQQMTKYAGRDGWEHRDILRLAHIKPATATHDALFTNAIGKSKDVSIDLDVANYMMAVETAKRSTNVKEVVALIEQYQLPREVINTELLSNVKVWEALMPHMGMEALVRNLATLTRIGMIAPMSDGLRTIVTKMSDADVVRQSKLHPIKVLAALLTYKEGRSVKGSNVWTPNQKILDALDEMFYATFQNIIPTGKKILLGLDVSASMTGGVLAGVPGLSPRVATAALAMVTARTEEEYHMFGFSTTFIPLKISANMRLDSVMAVMNRLPFAGTDCSLPMVWAAKNKVPVDAFAVYTDNDTNSGYIQPSQALREYRKSMNRESKLIVNGMTATNFTIADPKDVGMMDVVGFSNDAPSVMTDFIRGSI